jgi:hypothetical protein
MLSSTIIRKGKKLRADIIYHKLLLFCYYSGAKFLVLLLNRIIQAAPAAINLA